MPAPARTERDLTVLRTIATRIDPSDIVALQLRERAVPDRRSRVLEPPAALVTGDGGVQAAIVTDDRDAIARDAAIELERGYAKLERAGKRRQCVLGPQAAGAAVTLNVESYERLVR